MSTKSKKSVTADDDGNSLTPPAADSPVGQIIYLLEWGRQRGFQIGPGVQIGDVTVQVRDLRAAKASVAPAEEIDIWTAHGHTGAEDSVD